jgi:CubicO group peptidase (beta-lactamase class C family)
MLKRLLKWLLLGIAGLLLAILVTLFALDPVLTTRLLTMDQGPAETVAGGTLINLPTAPAAQRSIDQAALDAAVTYGGDTDSQALLVYRDGLLELEHYYTGYDATTRTPTQSMHKSVLAMLVGIAIEEGHIPSENSPAANWLHEWADDERASITIRQMLQQTSGIDFDSFSPNIRNGFFQLMLGDNIVPVALNNGTLFPPDTEFDYNSVNPQALGILLQRATGERYADYLSQVLWRHLGTPDATVVLDSIEHGMARTFCCLQATARSWLHLGVLHLQNGRFGGKQLVPAAWMQAIRSPGSIQPNYGYLTWLGSEWQEYRYYNRKTTTSVLHAEAFAAPDVIYFDGMGGQRVYIVPSEQLVIVRTGAIAMDWDDSRLPNLILRGIKKPGTKPGS